jgi:hypothetical protein
MGRKSSTQELKALWTTAGEGMDRLTGRPPTLRAAVRPRSLSMTPDLGVS